LPWSVALARPACPKRALRLGAVGRRQAPADWQGSPAGPHRGSCAPVGRACRGSGRWARSRSWRPVPATACVTPQRGERRRQRRGDLARPMAGCRASPPAASHRGCGAILPGRRAGAARWSRGQPV
jgi:hypothetical protein